MKELLFKMLIASCTLSIFLFAVVIEAAAQISLQVYTPEEKLILLTSGESRELSFRQESKSSSLIECQHAWGNENVVLILPGCKIVAQYPGRVGLISKQIDSTLTDEIEIRVKPKKIGEYFAGKSLTISMDKDLRQQWFLLTGLEKEGVYRADLTGNTEPGSSLRFIADSGRTNNSCGNTLLEKDVSLVCYFGVTRNAIIFAIDRAGAEPLRANLLVQPIADPLIRANFANTVSATHLSINKPVAGFVLANEIGSNSKHYYHYSVSLEKKQPLQVRLFDFVEGITLNVIWIDGHCTVEQLVIQLNQIQCTLPEKFLGNLTIVVDGNSDLNGRSVAKYGGGFYRLVVESK